MGTVEGWVKPHDRYSLMHLHARGGIGRIWVARDREVGRDVALKELLPERASQATHRARFLQEARITGQLEHPGILPVYELAQRADDQQPFYTMRLVRGRTLREAARTYHGNRNDTDAARLEFLALLNAFVTVCNTMAYAHSRGVIHRDLKGQNVVLGDFGEVVQCKCRENPWTLFRSDHGPHSTGPSLASHPRGRLAISRRSLPSC